MLLLFGLGIRFIDGRQIELLHEELLELIWGEVILLNFSDSP